MRTACGPCPGELLCMTWGYAEYLVKSFIQFDQKSPDTAKHSAERAFH